MKEFMIAMAREAGKMAMDFQAKAKVSSKGIKNTVTEADLAIEKFIVKKIKEKFPKHTIVGEEYSYDFDDSDVWYIDPIDGTTNYAHNDPHFCISIAYAKKGIAQNACIYLPRFDEMYYAEKGKGTELNGVRQEVTKTKELKDSFIQGEISPLKETIDTSFKVFRHFMINADRIRDMGFCAGQLAYVSAGRSDALIKHSQHPWDIAAGMLLVKESGGIVTDNEGKEIVLGTKEKRYNIVASNGIIHGEMLNEIRENFSDIDFKKNWW